MKQLLVGLVATLLAFGALAADVRLDLPHGGALVLSAPSGWKHAVSKAGSPMVTFTPETGNDFKVQLVVMVHKSVETVAMDPRVMNDMVGKGAKRAEAETGQRVAVRDFPKGGNANPVGSFFTVVDPEPKPGEFKYLTQGAVVIHGLGVTLTVLNNGEPQPYVVPTFKMLQWARRE